MDLEIQPAQRKIEEPLFQNAKTVRLAPHCRRKAEMGVFGAAVKGIFPLVRGAFYPDLLETKIQKNLTKNGKITF